MKSEDYVFNSLDDIIKFGVNQRGYWFRGHSMKYNELKPSVYRGKYAEWSILKQLYPEKFLYEGFRRYARSIATNLPQDNNYIEWLCLMQHHRLPTRLLDWTQNILVAIYFAIIDNKGEDGELFILDPYELNKIYDVEEMPSCNNEVLKYIASEPFINVDNPSNGKLHPKPKTPLAFLPNLFHPRLTAQKSAFTIHPSSNEEYNIRQIIEKKSKLIRIIIPSNKKYEMCLGLHNLGINNLSLFPDLDGLSKFLTIDYDSYGAGVFKPNMKEFTPTNNS